MMQLPCSFKHLALCQFTPSVPVQPVARGLPYSTPPMRRATTTFPSGALSSSVPDLLAHCSVGDIPPMSFGQLGR